MAKKLRRVDGRRLQARFGAMQHEPWLSPHWRPITLRALAIGVILLVTELLPIAWIGRVTLVRDGLLVLVGYLLHANLMRLRDRRFWRVKPGQPVGGDDETRKSRGE